MKNKILSLFIVFTLFCTVGFSQKKAPAKKPIRNSKVKGLSREQLESQRLSIIEEIKRTQNELVSLQKNKKASVDELLTLQSKLSARQKLISNINSEISIIDNNLSIATRDVTNLKTALDTLKKQYAEMVRYTYKNRTSSDLIVFLFSSNSFNDAIRRLHYVKQYRGYRADQAMKITSASQQLNNKITVLNNVKQKKDFVLQAQQMQSKILEIETAQKDKVVSEIKGKEKELTLDLAKKRKEAENLNNAIAAVIRREIEIAQKRAIDEKMRLDKERRQKELALKKAELNKKLEEESLAQKRKLEEENRRLALAKKQAEERERQALADKQKREEQEQKLLQERKLREEQERKLAQQRKEREEQERKASKMQEAKRIERERELAIEKEKQEALEKQLAKAKKQQEEKQRDLLAEKQRQEEYQRRLTEDKKKREIQEQRNANAQPYNNPRYNPSLASSEREKQLELAYDEPIKPKANKTLASDDFKYSLTPSERELTNTLEANKGRLPWPVEKGYVVEHFGKNKHPVFNIVSENYGVDIRTSRGASARSVYPGEVISILSLPGTGNTVIVSHGSYYTVYGKLSSVNVSKGSKVGLKQKIGTVMINDEGNANFHFEIWKAGINGGSSKLNPEIWIAQ